MGREDTDKNEDADKTTDIHQKISETVKRMRAEAGMLPILILQLNGSRPDAQAVTAKAILRCMKALFRYPKWSESVMKRELTPAEWEPMPYTMEEQKRIRLEAALNQVEEILRSELR